MTSELLFHPFGFHMDMFNVFHALGEKLQIHEEASGEGAKGDEGEGENDIVVPERGRRGQPIDGVGGAHPLAADAADEAALLHLQDVVGEKRAELGVLLEAFT